MLLIHILLILFGDYYVLLQAYNHMRTSYDGLVIANSETYIHYNGAIEDVSRSTDAYFQDQDLIAWCHSECYNCICPCVKCARSMIDCYNCNLHCSNWHWACEPEYEHELNDCDIDVSLKCDCNLSCPECRCSANATSGSSCDTQFDQQITSTSHAELGDNNNNNARSPAQTIVTVINECAETVLLGMIGPTSDVVPVEKRWDIAPDAEINIVIPDSWKATQGLSVIGPRFWPRTGCKYNASANKAQCETGDCANLYNCTGAQISGSIPVSLAEFCFECGQNNTFYDVSLVDGYSVSINVKPMQPYGAFNPSAPNDTFWCINRTCNTALDLKSFCPGKFALSNTALSSFALGSDVPSVVACFSNCGYYEYPTAPAIDCNASASAQCQNWRKYCCQSPSSGQPCNSDGDCEFGEACYFSKCECRAYYRNATCNDSVCTYPESQPVPGNCTSEDCIGDDVLHSICPRAYSWPNDPQTFDCNAERYEIKFCPKGSNAFLSKASDIPKCAALNETYYDYASAQNYCGSNLGEFACAHQIESSQFWECNVTNSACNGVLCYTISN